MRTLAPTKRGVLRIAVCDKRASSIANYIRNCLSKLKIDEIGLAEAGAPNAEEKHNGS